MLAINTARSSNDIRPSQPILAGTVAFTDPATDETLVATAKMGDEEAFARRLGLSVAAVKGRLFHGRKKLRRTLRRLEITPKDLQRSAVAA